MKNIFNVKISAIIFSILTAIMIIIHLLITINILPPNIVWGGSITNRNELIKMEIIAITILFMFITIELIRSEIIQIKKYKIIQIILSWLIFIYLILNTIGNILSSTNIEKILFSLTTFILAILSLRISIYKNNKISGQQAGGADK